MTNEHVSFVFFGSGPVAAENLRQLTAFFNIEAVITKPTTEREMREASAGAPLFCVQNKQELDELIEQQNFKSSVGVLIDFGIIVSNTVIGSFEKGIVNSHFSLLPQWRGADPISFSILSGQEITGVSLMLLVEKMDEGPLLGQAEVHIEATDTTTTLTQMLIDVSSGLIKGLLPEWVSGNIAAGDQLEVTLLSDTEPTYSRKLAKEDGLIDWHKPADQIEREIRAFAEWPKSYTRLGDIDCVITKAHSITESSTDEPSTISTDGKQLFITCGDGTVLCIDELKPAGKKNMDARSFLAGYRQRLQIS